MRFGEIKKQLAEGWNNGEDRVHLPDEPSLYWSGKGPLQNEYDALYEKLVPSQGKADTIEGEVLRAASKIVYRHYNDGDEFNAASYRQLEKYIGKVTSYDDLAHKSTEFAVKANGQYHPNADWDCLAVMDYGPVDDYDDEDEDEDEDEYGWEEDDDELEESSNVVARYADDRARGTGFVYNVDATGQITSSGNFRHNKKYSTPEKAMAYLEKCGFTKKGELEEADMFKAGQRAIKNIKSATQQRKSEAEKMAQAQAQIDADRENERDRFSQEELYPSDDSHDVDEGMEEFAKSQAKQRAAKRKSIPWPKEVPTDAEQERNRTRDEEENDPHPYTQVNEYDDEDEYEDEDQGFFVAIGSEDDGGFVGMVTKDGGKWREGRVSGKAPYNWGGSYMGYLTPDDVMTWIRKDYRNYDVEGPFDSEEEAREYAQNQYSLDEAKWFKTSYGWAGGRNEKTGGTYKHPDQIKADREAKKAAKAQQSKDAMTSMFGGDASELTSKLNIKKDVDEARTTWNNDFYVYDPKTKAVKKKFRTHKGATQYAEANGLKVASAEYYHDSVSKEVEEGWESGPEERTRVERDPDAEYDARRQEKLDAEADSAQARRPQTKVYTLSGRGPNNEPNYAFPGEYDSQAAADAARKKLMANPKTPNPRDIGIRVKTKYMAEDIEPTNPVERAVLAAIRELIQQGHTEVAPEVITNMVVAATSKPFLLKDLVDANKNSPAIQHYVDSINPSKVKFSSDILTVKNENPAKDKEQSQASVSAMAAKAANRPRLGEGQSTPLRDRDDYQAKQKALQDIQLDPHTHQDTQLSSELARRKAELIQQAKQLGISESRAHKIIANKLKQIELQRKMGSPESDAAHATHINRMKKSKEDYLAKNPNSIYKK